MSDREGRSSDPQQAGDPLLDRRKLITTGVVGAAAAYGLTASRGLAGTGFLSSRFFCQGRLTFSVYLVKGEGVIVLLALSVR